MMRVQPQPFDDDYPRQGGMPAHFGCSVINRARCKVAEPNETPRTVSRGRESNPQEADLQSAALTILPPRRGKAEEGRA